MIDRKILDYNNQAKGYANQVCAQLCELINANLPDSEHKVWHGHPVWFINGNPIVGYAIRKDNVQLLFWSGQTFDEPGLNSEGSFKASDVKYTDVEQINSDDIIRWLQKAQDIQWNYKDIVKLKGQLNRIK